MIKILPLKDKLELNSLNKQNNLNASFAFCLYDGEGMDGYILYNVNSKCGEIIKITADNPAYVDGLVRAVLASLCDISIDKAAFGEQIDLELLKSLSILQDGNEIASIKELIYNCRKCKSKTNCAECTLK